MARGKQRREEPAAPQVPVPQAERFSLLEYTILVVVFGLLCILQYVVVGKLTKETEGLSFFFGSLFVGFAVVAFLSWLHDLFYEDDVGDDEA